MEGLTLIHALFIAAITIAPPTRIGACGPNCLVPKCRFPAIYVFGDSNSDTGGATAAGIMQVNAPNGQTYFGHPAGRMSDGRLIIDFIAETLGLPYPSAYLEPTGTGFRHGANFAVSGSSVLPTNSSPIHLERQVSQFIHFKARITALYDGLRSKEKVEVLLKASSFPRPKDFPKALYFIDIGQNDLRHRLDAGEEVLRTDIPYITGNISEAIQRLYNEGARFFWVHNTGPIGCLPSVVQCYKEQSGYAQFDQFGCAESGNKIAQTFNQKLKDLIAQLRMQFPQGVFTLVDMYAAKYELVSIAKKQGFADPTIACMCKANAPIPITLCKDPSRHISWDEIHYSEAANHWIANRIMNGSLSDPPLSIKEACRRM